MNVSSIEPIAEVTYAARYFKSIKIGGRGSRERLELGQTHQITEIELMILSDVSHDKWSRSEVVRYWLEMRLI